MRLAITPARLALLGAVAAGHVQHGYGPNGMPGRRRIPVAWNISDPHRGPQCAAAAIRDMTAAGWVDPELPPGSATYRLTPLGRGHLAVRICDYGTHAMAETGPESDPTVIGQMRNGGLGRYVVQVGHTVTVILGRPRPAAVDELRHQAAQALADLETDQRRLAAAALTPDDPALPQDVAEILGLTEPAPRPKRRRKGGTS